MPIGGCRLLVAATEEELSAKEVELIRRFRSNDPSVGYNRWPKLNLRGDA